MQRTLHGRLQLSCETEKSADKSVGTISSTVTRRNIKDSQF